MNAHAHTYADTDNSRAHALVPVHATAHEHIHPCLHLHPTSTDEALMMLFERRCLSLCSTRGAPLSRDLCTRSSALVDQELSTFNFLSRNPLLNTVCPGYESCSCLQHFALPSDWIEVLMPTSDKKARPPPPPLPRLRNRSNTIGLYIC